MTNNTHKNKMVYIHHFFSKSALLLLIIGASLMSACGEDNDDTVNIVNNNRNDVSTYPEAARKEFPKLKDNGNNIVIVHYTSNGEINYSVEWDVEKQSQRWSCYQIYAGNRSSNTSRYYGNPQYPFDPELSSEIPYFGGDDPFKGSGFDHGHICPSADRLNSAEANYQTFFLTNMQPQYNAFNAGVWAHMEDYMRSKITKSSSDTLFICKGGTIDNESQILMHRSNGLIVPKYFFMAALLKRSESNIGAMGFYIEQRKVDDYDRTSDGTKYDLSPHVVNINELERLTGLDFFCNLPDDIEELVEGKSADFLKSVWGPMVAPNLTIQKNGK
ncbi:DNA/RNA non-specific endonuclease [Xylanibacter brevis]|uniref:DNA/RNA non-specific endonuclease n=1 Tax=Xylanibacter brevis TaxID=83231 RepID=UPI00200AEDE1|nr:DNA/RNA non-specific endonuclease [Xylanibacter brevis]